MAWIHVEERYGAGYLTARCCRIRRTGGRLGLWKGAHLSREWNKTRSPEKTEMGSLKVSSNSRSEQQKKKKELWFPWFCSIENKETILPFSQLNTDWRRYFFTQHNSLVEFTTKKHDQAKKPTKVNRRWHAYQITETLPCCSLSWTFEKLFCFKSRNHLNIFLKPKWGLPLRNNYLTSVWKRWSAAFLTSIRHWTLKTISSSWAQSGTVKQVASPPPDSVISMSRWHQERDPISQN